MKCCAPERAPAGEARVKRCPFSGDVVLPPAQQQDVEAGANRPPDLHRISRMERYAGPCIMAGFILGATAAGQGMIASILKDPILIVIQVGVSLMACLSLWLVGVVDPGTVAWTEDEPPTEAQDPHTTHSTSTRERVDAKGDVVTDRWCKTCRLWRPPRASHCSKCNRCFFRFDHHCPVMGTCIAQENTRFFIGFLGFSSIAAACAAIQGFAGVAAIFAEVDGDISAGFTNPLTIFVLGYTLVMGFTTFSVGLFFLGHVGMLLCSITTKEAIRGANTTASRNPCADKCEDLTAICCSPCRPRYSRDTPWADFVRSGDGNAPSVGGSRAVVRRGDENERVRPAPDIARSS